MILAAVEDGLRVVRQTDHGDQTGRFAAAWGNEDVAPLTTHTAAVRLAATHHDDGWAGWERRPTLDPATGQPVQFLHLTPVEHVPLYRYGIERAAQQDPWAGLLVSMHGAGLYNNRYGTFQLVEQSFSAPERALVDEFLADMARLQQDLAVAAGWTAPSPGWTAPSPGGHTPDAGTPASDRHVSEDPVARYEYLLLQVWDRLSLQYAYRSAANGDIAPLPVPAGPALTLECRNLGVAHLGLRPYPFVEDGMTFELRQVTVENRRYRSPEDFLEAVAGARVEHLECRASRIR